MNTRTQGQHTGWIWAASSTPREILRLENALGETMPGEDFVAVMSDGMDLVFAAAFAVIVSGDENVDVNQFLRDRGLNLAAMNEVDFARGFLEGALGRSEEAEDPPVIVSM